MYTLSAGQATITGYTGPGGAVVIPSTLDGHPVVGLVGNDASPYPDNSAFGAKAPLITSVVIPSSVNTIGSRAFYMCSALVRVTVPDSVTTIGESAFWGCTALTGINASNSVDLPTSVVSLGGYAFGGCSSIRNLRIPASITILADGVFADCTSLVNVTILSGVQWIGSAFDGCSSLTSIAIPDSVTYMSGSFAGCSGLRNVHMSDGIWFIGGQTFWGCSSLASLTIPDNVSSIQTWAFAYCTSLTTVGKADGTLNGVTYIGDHAFEGCSALTSIAIPSGVTSIGHNLFMDCSSLATVTVPDSVTTLGDYAFYNCSSLRSLHLPDNIAVIDWDTFAYCSSLASIDLPGNLVELWPGALQGCSSLTSLVVPASVTYIGAAALSDCSKLAAIYFLGDYPYQNQAGSGSASAGGLLARPAGCDAYDFYTSRIKTGLWDFGTSRRVASSPPTLLWGALRGTTYYTLTYVAGTGGYISGLTPQSIAAGANGVSVRAMPRDGYTFVRWSDGLTDDTRAETNVRSDATLSAEFALIPVVTHTISASAGAGGTIAPSGDVLVDHGSSKTFGIAPNTGFHVATVLVDGASQGAIGSYTFSNVTTNHAISASFAVNTYMLTYTAGSNGTISGSTPQTVEHDGHGTQVIAVADRGYRFVTWSDGLGTASRTDTNVTHSIVLTATFERVPPTYEDVEGATRYETAIAASRSVFATGTVSTVIIACGEDAHFTDALVAAPIAGVYGAPVLLTSRNAMIPATLSEIRRLGATRAIIIGGTGAVSRDVFESLSGELGAGSVNRIGGADRYGTATLVAEEIRRIHPLDGTIFVATGSNFPDALVAGCNSWINGRPILLVGPSGVPSETSAAISSLGCTRAVLLGGAGVISQSAANTIKSKLVGQATPVRLAGDTRYDTAVAVATWSANGEGSSWATLGVATGASFADAVSAGPNLGMGRGVMLLTQRTELPISTRNALTQHKASVLNVRFFGGTGAISASARASVKSVLR